MQVTKSKKVLKPALDAAQALVRPPDHVDIRETSGEKESVYRRFFTKTSRCPVAGQLSVCYTEYRGEPNAENRESNSGL
jgi:hypothetical protein